MEFATLWCCTRHGTIRSNCPVDQSVIPYLESSLIGMFIQSRAFISWRILPAWAMIWTLKWLSVLKSCLSIAWWRDIILRIYSCDNGKGIKKRICICLTDRVYYPWLNSFVPPYFSSNLSRQIFSLVLSLSWTSSLACWSLNSMAFSSHAM